MKSRYRGIARRCHPPIQFSATSKIYVASVGRSQSTLHLSWIGQVEQRRGFRMSHTTQLRCITNRHWRLTRSAFAISLISVVCCMSVSAQNPTCWAKVVNRGAKPAGNVRWYLWQGEGDPDLAHAGDGFGAGTVQRPLSGITNSDGVFLYWGSESSDFHFAMELPAGMVAGDLKGCGSTAKAPPTVRYVDSKLTVQR